MEDKLAWGCYIHPSSRFILGSGKICSLHQSDQGSGRTGRRRDYYLALRRATPRKRKYFGSYPEGGNIITAQYFRVPET